jgi:5'-3' exonuclease
MLSDESEIIDFYPKDFKVDTKGIKYLFILIMPIKGVLIVNKKKL